MGKSNTKSVEAKKRIVIPIVAGIGNALMAVPMVRQLKRGMPDSLITVLARNAAMAEPFARLPECDAHVVCGGGSGGVWRMIREARSRKPDLYLIPFPSNRWQYNALAASSRAAEKAMHAYPTPRISSMAFGSAQRVPADRGIHDVLQNLRLIEALGVKIDPNDQPNFPIHPADQTAASLKFAQAGIKPGERFIVIHAGSAQTVLAQAKRWPAERYAMLIQSIARVYQMLVVIVEGPDEPGVAQSIIKHVEPARARAIGIKLDGPLGEAAAVLAASVCYVGTDSGLAHLAAAVGKKTVTLFAPADPDRVCPSGNRQLVVQPSKMCTPCFMYPWEATRPKMRCTPPYCIGDIAIESVMAKLKMAMPIESR